MTPLRALAVALLLALALPAAAQVDYRPPSVSPTGGTFTGPVLLCDGTAAAPCWAFASDPNTGGYSAGADILGLTAGGTGRLAVHTTGPRLQAAGALSWSATSDPAAAADVLLYRDAAATLALRDGVTAQALYVYKTSTDASNYKRLALLGTYGAESALLMQGAGTGVNPTMTVGTQGTGSLSLATNSTGRWTVDGSTGNLLAAAATDIGTNVTTAAPTNIYALTNMHAGGVVQGNAALITNGYVAVGADSFFYWAGRSVAKSPTNGSVRFTTLLETEGVLLDFSADAFLKLRDRAGTGGAVFNLLEQTAPAAAAANSVHFFAEDNGAGKTRLMAQFASGAAQQVAIEP